MNHGPLHSRLRRSPHPRRHPQGSRGSDAQARRRLVRRTHAAHVRRHHPAAAPLARPQPRRVFRSAARRRRRGSENVRGFGRAEARHSRTPGRPELADRQQAERADRRRARLVGAGRVRTRLGVDLHRRRDLARAAGGLDRPRHRAARTPVRSGARRISQRDVRQRRRADHRDRRALQRAHRPDQSLDYRQHRRQPAAGARRIVLRRRPRTPLAEIQSDRGDQHHRPALSRGRRAGDARGVRSRDLRQARRAAAGDRAPEPLARWRDDRGVCRKPGVRVDRAAGSVPTRAPGRARSRRDDDHGSHGDADGRAPF